MDNQTNFSIKATRDNLSHLVDQANLNQKTFIITKFGRPKAILAPLPQPKEKLPKLNLKLIKGLWADRIDITDSAKWVADLRTSQNSR